MSKYDLSVIIASRTEEFLKNTIDDVLKNRRGKTECIVICDGDLPITPIPDHPDVTLVLLPKSIGQRAAINMGARLSKSPWIMKSDAHVSFSPGFDVTLMKDCEPDWLVVPRLYNLHAFDWKCVGCDARSYQGPKPNVCGTCRGTDFEKVMVWLPRDGEHWACSECKKYFHSKEAPSKCPECGASKKFAGIGLRVTDSQRVDDALHFQYWRDFHPQEGIAAFIHAKGSGWIKRLLDADIETPSGKLLSRMKEYVSNYEALPLKDKYRLRAKAIKILAHIRAAERKHKVKQLLSLIELAQGHLVETMSLLGACWVVRKDFFFDVLGGLDVQIGSWGQMGQELSAKVWTSGGRVICNRSAWYAHLFRTASGFSFPYHMDGSAQEAAKQYSRNLWFNNAWPGQKYPLSYIIDRFHPVPDWTKAAIAQQKAREVGWKPKK